VANAKNRRLWCVTHDVYARSSDDTSAFDALSRSVVWGFGRSLQHEQPRLSCTLIDFDAELSAEAECELLASEFRRNSESPQVRFVSGLRQVAKVSESAALERASAVPAVPARLSANGSYLVTGGAGALGRLAVEELVTCGAGHVIILSRQPTGLDELRAWAEGHGARLSQWAIDVGDRALLERELEALSVAGPPLRGIIHAAGVLQDKRVEQLEPSDLQTVLRPKVSGAWNLHELSLRAPLDFFITYSSLAGLLGSPGQANYAGANAFLDALVEARNRAGLVGTSLGWGPWTEAGMAAGAGGAAERLSRSGIGGLSNAEGRAFLSAVLSGPAADSETSKTRGAFHIASIAWQDYAQGVDPRLHSVMPIESGDTLASPAGQVGAELRALIGSEPSQVRQRLRDYLQERVHDVAGSRVVSERDSFFDLGLDSLQAVAMRNRIERDLGIDLSPSLIFDYPSLADLLAHLLYDHLGMDRATDALVPAAQAFVASPLASAWSNDAPNEPEPEAESEQDAADLLARLEASLHSLEQALEP
jgi:acyl carrier protein